jgi:hypothetical protein
MSVRTRLAVFPVRHGAMPLVDRHGPDIEPNRDYHRQAATWDNGLARNLLTPELALADIRSHAKRGHVFHGTDGDSILGIIRDSSMRPDQDGLVYFSERFDDALQHGADRKRGASFAFKAGSSGIT